MKGLHEDGFLCQVLRKCVQDLGFARALRHLFAGQRPHGHAQRLRQLGHPAHLQAKAALVMQGNACQQLAGLKVAQNACLAAGRLQPPRL